MQIDCDNLQLHTESDVEQKVIAPLLLETNYLGIPQEKIFTKQYLAPTKLDKVAGKTGGYVPDYSVWMRSFPVFVVEAKEPEVAVEVGYREASLYARHLNQAYPTNINPCRFILATNGVDLLFGYWDSEPALRLKVSGLRIGSTAVSELRTRCSAEVLDAYASECVRAVKNKNFSVAYEIIGGKPVINAKTALNSFAAPLSPVLRRYFSSSNQENVREIAERAYVSTAEVTEYDNVLESLLKERLTVKKDTIVVPLEPDRRGEEHVAKAISDFDKDRPQLGQLQLIQGAVGSGKSLFIVRYKDVLQSSELADRTRWSFVDFNTGPADLADAETWLCKAFVESFESENPEIDISSNQVLRGMFSRNIQRRRGIYEELEKISPEQAAIQRAEDLMKWQDDPKEQARGVADYVLGSRREILVCVMDNVDRLDLKSQLNAFQLSLWFMGFSRAFVILQMRDETYERFKDKPPLDTFRSGITFHISPPRFIDVVKRRLELSLTYLAAQSGTENESYQLESGIKITYPQSELGTFLRALYIELFERKHNISRILESLAGRDVRRALDMFVSVITSGHLSPTTITSNVIGGGGFPIKEHVILKILMRTDYRFASDHSGYIINILGFEPEWEKPDNFLLSEILYYLVTNRKIKGQIGIEGYFTCRHLANELQRYGYVPDDTLKALNYLLRKQLISADHLNFASVTFDDSVRILASGYMHLRVLSARLEYLYGVLPTVPVSDEIAAHQIARIIERENKTGATRVEEKARGMEILLKYLTAQKDLRDKTPFATERSGASYLISQINDAITHFRTGKFSDAGDDPLDV